MERLIANIKRIVVVGTSSGGIETLRTLASGVPADLAAPICIVIHRHPQSQGLTAGILGGAGPLPARDAEDGERLENGRIYVAPVDRHLIVEPGQLRLARGPRENLSRPAIDPLFRSAAQVYGPAAIGVILTGDLDDGAAGLDTIRRAGRRHDRAGSERRAGAVDATERTAVRAGGLLRARCRDSAVLQRPGRGAPRNRRQLRVPRDVEVEVNIAKEDARPMDTGLERNRRTVDDRVPRMSRSAAAAQACAAEPLPLPYRTRLLRPRACRSAQHRGGRVVMGRSAGAGRSRDAADGTVARLSPSPGGRRRWARGAGDADRSAGRGDSGVLHERSNLQAS